MLSLKKLLSKYNPAETDTRVSREFQEFGLRLAEELNDPLHRSLYIKLAKTTPRLLLEAALSYVRDAKVRNRAALFMWKLKQLKNARR